MTVRKLFLTWLVLAISLSVTCARRGNRLESWDTAGKLFRVRVTAYEEKRAFLSGTYYVFESARVDADNWHEFMTFRHDDQPEIPRDQVRFLSEQIGYAFMGWMYAVTTDGGNNWSVWDATRDVPDWQWSKYGVMKDVNIKSDGTGTMTLTSIADPNSKVPEFSTRDFGRHWRVE